MNIFKNIPTEEAINIADLIQTTKYQVLSKSLADSDAFDMRIFSFGTNEDITDEEYYGDVFYYLINGDAQIIIEDKVIELSDGACAMVKAHKTHAIKALNNIKMLQITLNNEEK